MSSRVQFPDLRDIAPKKLVIAGDWHRHMYANHAKKVIKYAKEIGADGIIHVGDLGYQYDEGKLGGKTFEKPLRYELEKNDLFMVWIDGNHENHQWLRSLPIRDDGFVQTGSGGRILWAPRGHRWTWNDVTFGALGGAYSINGDYLVEGVSQFSDLEEPKIEDLSKLGNEKLDILLTHEVPYGVPVKTVFNLSKIKEERSLKSRMLLRYAVEGLKPEHVFSGHWHQRVDHELHRTHDHGITQCHVLNMEYYENNIVILDLENMSVSNPKKNWNSTLTV